MKKKFLSLMMAAAVVATTSVSAFAEDTTTVTKYEGTANVNINGSVDSNNGASAPGTISVSVPTAMNFRVDSQGNLEGSKITITNRGVDKVDFEKRSDVALWLVGNASDRAYLQSEADGTGEKGIYDADGNKAPEGGIVVSKIEANNGIGELVLDGYAGNGALDNADKTLSGKFTLKLKIKKSTS